MKLAHRYAQVLARYSPEEARGEAFERFIAYLKRRGHEKLLSRILSEYARIRERERRRNQVTLFIPNEADAQSPEVQQALSARGLEAEDVAIETDDTLIGGFRLEGAGWHVDTSYKRGLLDLYNRLINAR